MTSPRSPSPPPTTTPTTWTRCAAPPRAHSVSIRAPSPWRRRRRSTRRRRRRGCAPASLRPSCRKRLQAELELQSSLTAAEQQLNELATKGGLPGAGVNREEVTAIRDQLHTQQRLHAERFASLEAQIRQANAAADDASAAALASVRPMAGTAASTTNAPMQLVVEAPAAPPTRYSVAVPDGVAPGESFEANVGSVITRVTVPAVDELGGAAPPTELVVESPPRPSPSWSMLRRRAAGRRLRSECRRPADENHRAARLPPAGTGVAGAAAALLAPAAGDADAQEAAPASPATPSSVDDSSSELGSEFDLSSESSRCASAPRRRAAATTSSARCSRCCSRNAGRRAARRRSSARRCSRVWRRPTRSARCCRRLARPRARAPRGARPSEAGEGEGEAGEGGDRATPRG